ncbi:MULTISPECIES: hypothetical protein [unclassified Bradyrhizobium]|uniref:hypothetical protein n=1 Tax=unclassified Bradyrhizobium TaxID=2631580 RepID=UPI0007091A10|nr:MULTISPECIES: hypothetical protein [unclassified Bradyrhizobium]KQT21720.1 hypothetical protein ASG57_26720 [Bradyrhizobium sp. Leaf396]
MPAAQKASKGDPDTRAFLASLNLVEWGAALEAAKRLLIALDAPPVAPDALVRLQKLIRYHGEQYTTLVIRTVIESDGNELALIEPVISAVSDVMRRHPEWPEKGVAWIEAFDGIPLLQIVETMRGLEIFRETSIGTYLAVSLESRLARLFTISPAPEVAPPAKIPMSQARIPVILAKVRLGLELAALRDRTPNNRKFGELARAKCDLAASEVSELIRVARAYGDREEIISRLSWAALVILSGSTLSTPTRQSIEKRILAGERISPRQIVEAGKAKATSRAKPSAKRLSAAAKPAPKCRQAGGLSAGL